MAQKKLQKGSQFEHYDIDNNGEITDGEFAMAKRIEELEHQREMHRNLDKMQDQQRLMAWVAMGSMVLFVVAMMTPIINVVRVNELSGFLNTFFVSQAAVVSVFMGATAYSKRNNDLTVQSKGEYSK
jgi:hypothetical protein